MNTQKAERAKRWMAAQPRFKAEHDARIRRRFDGEGWTNPGAPVTPEQFDADLRRSAARRKG